MPQLYLAEDIGEQNNLRGGASGEGGGAAAMAGGGAGGWSGRGRRVA
ncbi:MAG: hypothetical protein M5U09_18230 [Gammaproteobacteria bacterium]|nr:hypothetical protein [Gammaproteobacteria bacterium]